MPKKPNPTDQHVGKRVRMRRMMLGISQERLGGELGLTFQQIQKYEKGTNRVSSSRLQQLSNILQVPIPFFFEGGPNVGRAGSKSKTPDYITAFLATSDGLVLVRSFTCITDTKLRRSIVHLVEELAGS